MRLLAIFVTLALAFADQRPPSIRDDDFSWTWRGGVTTAHSAADTLVVKTRNAGRPPRQTDPAGSQLLDEIFNIAVFPRALSASSLGLIQDWLNSVMRTGNLYLTAGMDAPGIKNDDAAIASLAQENIVTYGPEVGRYFDAALQLISELDDAMYQIVSNHPNQLSPTENQLNELITKETTILLTDVLDAMTMPEIGKQWQNERMSELRTVGAGAARFLLSPDQKRSVRQAAEAAENATSDQDLKDKLTEFSLSFREPTAENW